VHKLVFNGSGTVSLKGFYHSRQIKLKERLVTIPYALREIPDVDENIIENAFNQTLPG